MPLSAKLGSA